ncbi:hypothetical protein SAMN05444344_2499 [Tenacibaculum mesophilum]|uniref:Tissue inhibitor of metalloproteinase n=1 Tax=Tenacibaculum mesophilum TaxID=104268 RepID=A0ABN5T716_9FLAO|nr:hypothetical protein [Tenacibaculum mesophilum]AZJ31751.1 hypothetical protein D6200_03885 [Tenacibaculum mesophilum]QFS27005.1 hypothetical protein F9Y86_00750 [Tenacibaculum mesophilum]SHG03916.1 hypothetical protein SAMN05444344_2499 [Tenacibaculum mesophilum]
MRRFLFLGILLYSSYLYPCDCGIETIVNKFAHSSFVAKGKIIKNYKNLKGENVYKADIKIDKLYKGEKIESIFVYGRSDEKMGTSCDIFIPEETELIFYAHKDKSGRLIIGMCSGLLYLNKESSREKEKEIRELKILKSLSKLNDRDINKVKLYSSEIGDLLDDLKGYDSKKKYGIYKLIFSKKLRLKRIKVVDGFTDKNVDKKIKRILKNVKWEPLRYRDSIKLKNNYIYFLDIYHYSREKNNKSFYTIFNL